MSLLVELVRSPRSLLHRPLAELLVPLLAATVLGGAAFGLAVGAHHSLLQGLSAAVKMPLVLLVPPLVAVPAVRALAGSFHLELPAGRAAAAALVCVARIALFAAALAPGVWLLSGLGGYRWAVLWATVALGLAGLPGVMVLARAPDGDEGPRRLAMTAGSVVIFGALAMQTTWLLCPFILRDHLPVVFLEPPRSDVFTELSARVDGPPPRPEVGQPPRVPDAAPLPAERVMAIGYLE